VPATTPAATLRSRTGLSAQVVGTAAGPARADTTPRPGTAAMRGACGDAVSARSVADPTVTEDRVTNARIHGVRASVANFRGGKHTARRLESRLRLLSDRRLAVLVMVAAAALVGFSVHALHTQASPAASGGGIAPLKVVTCNDIAIFGNAASPRRRILFARVAVPRESFVMQPHAAQANRPLPYFAKQGIQLHSGRQPVEVLVPNRWRSRFAIGWGENGGPQQASAVRLLACSPVLGHAWLTYPGGYFVRKPACVPLVIRIGRETTRIRLSIGKSCVN
jgi:hypothetical protein